MLKIHKPKKNVGGRPFADTSPITLRLHASILTALDNYRREQKDLPNRPETLRRLVQEALKAKGYLPDASPVDSSPSQPGDQPAKKGQDRND